MNLNQSATGILFAVSGVLVLSPDSLLIRMIDADMWTLMCLRGTFMAISLALLSLLLRRGGLKEALKSFDRYAFAMVALMTLATFMFVLSIQTTSVAHSLVIVGTSPIIAALIAYVVLGEKISVNSWVTIFIVLIGLTVVVNDQGQSSLLGDFYAILCSLSVAPYFILAKMTRVRNIYLVMIMTGLCIALISLPLSSVELLSQRQWFLTALLGTLVGLAYSLLTLAPRYIAAPQVALFMPLETVFGSFFVWLVLGEYPGSVSLIAGSIIILAIMQNSYVQITRS